VGIASNRAAGATTHRIVDGIGELFAAGLWPLGILILCTSIAIPLLKLVGLSWFMLSVWRGSGRALPLKTATYRFIDEIGRWSCIDVFTRHWVDSFEESTGTKR
jgi:paraquat-inducible protein A